MKPALAARISFMLNGRRTSLRVHPLKRLLDVLREDYGLTGTKEGCGEGECGACTVIVDGKAVNSCLIPVAHIAGSTVRTIESLRGRHPLQRAFATHGGAQCGICTPGMIMAAIALGKRPTREQVREGLAGNICRCTGYEGIYRSIKAGTGDRGPGTSSANPQSPIPNPESRRKRASASSPAGPAATKPRGSASGATGLASTKPRGSASGEVGSRS
jgi:aerobic-type carbon monoxide dehydrogenase small subunit (CoxS/CutS family)